MVNRKTVDRETGTRSDVGRSSAGPHRQVEVYQREINELAAGTRRVPIKGLHFRRQCSNGARREIVAPKREGFG
jgi:hypothetical protein